MIINVFNTAGIANKYVRFIKWKLYQLKRKFDHLIYAEVYIKAEGQKPRTYYINVRFGIPGNDIILKSKSTEMKILSRELSQAAHRYLNKTKEAVANS